MMPRVFTAEVVNSMAYEEDDELEKEPIDDVEDEASDEKSDEDKAAPIDESPEKEIEDSEEIGKEEANTPEQEINENADELLAGLKPEERAEVKSSGNPEIDRYKNFMDQYRKLQAQRKNADLVNGLIAAGGKVGQSIAGKYSGNFVPDQNGNQMLAKMAERPAQDFEQSQVVQGRGMQLQSEMAANDPNSPQSRLVRSYVEKRLGLKLDDNVSAADAQMLLKTVGRPVQTKFQKVNGTWTDPDTGQAKRMSAVFDPSTGSYKDADTGKTLPGFLAEGLNPFQTNIDPNTGQTRILNKSRGTFSPVSSGQAPVGKATTPQEVNASLDPITRKELNDKVTPAFNKETEKIQQRLNHVPVILQRLEEAQQNPAALPQLKAELARFDVGDQRLAQQELEMFAKRQGYKGWADLLQAKTEGTISSDFANDMRQAISHVSDNLKDQLSQSAEKHAKVLANRLPPGQKVDPKTIAPLIYGEYQPHKAQQGDMVQVVSAKTGKPFMLPQDKVKEALAKKLIQPLEQ